MRSTLLIVLGILVLVVFVGGCSYNGMNKSRLKVDKAWADVQGAYQRRADLIPNLVATVKGAANFERSTYVDVANARAGNLKTATQIPADSVTPQRLAQIQQASAEAQNAARMLINVVVERYPDLKATQNFTDLQTQIEGTENRINTERRNYNGAVEEYNYKVTSFPGNLLAGMFGMKPRVMFQADEGAQRAPQVQF